MATTTRAVVVACVIFRKDFSNEWLAAVAGSVWLAFLSLVALIVLQRVRALPRAS